jgi:hypothetical protein
LLCLASRRQGALGLAPPCQSASLLARFFFALPRALRASSSRDSGSAEASSSSCADSVLFCLHCAEEARKQLAFLAELPLRFASSGASSLACIASRAALPARSEAKQRSARQSQNRVAQNSRGAGKAAILAILFCALPWLWHGAEQNRQAMPGKQNRAHALLCLLDSVFCATPCAESSQEEAR